MFEVYFSLRGKEYAVGGKDDPDAKPEGEDQDQQAEGQQGAGGAGGEALSPEELAAMLYKALKEFSTDQNAAKVFAPGPK